MINWLRHKKFPDYWDAYVNSFKHSKNKDLETTRFVVFDTETTGLSAVNDRVLSIGAVGVCNKTIHVLDSFECYIKQVTFNTETVSIHGILKEGNMVKIDEEEAVIRFLDYIKNSVLVAHHTAFDVAMINRSLKRLKLPKLKNKTLDTGILYKKLTQNKDEYKHYSLDKLCEVYSIEKYDRHTASGDAYITALVFLKILSKMGKDREVSLKYLFLNLNKRGLL